MAPEKHPLSGPRAQPWEGGFHGSGASPPTSTKFRGTPIPRLPTLLVPQTSVKWVDAEKRNFFRGFRDRLRPRLPPGQPPRPSEAATTDGPERRTGGETLCGDVGKGRQRLSRPQSTIRPCHASGCERRKRTDIQQVDRDDSSGASRHPSDGRSRPEGTEAIQKAGSALNR